MQSSALSKLHPSPYSRLMLSNLCPEQAKVGRQIHKTISISCYIQILTLVAVEYGCVKIMRNNSARQNVTALRFTLPERKRIGAIQCPESPRNMFELGRIRTRCDLYKYAWSKSWTRLDLCFMTSIKILTVCFSQSKD